MDVRLLDELEVEFVERRGNEEVEAKAGLFEHFTDIRDQSRVEFGGDQGE